MASYLVSDEAAYALYQITCSHNATKDAFEKKLGDFLVEMRAETNVSVTVNSVVHSTCIYTSQGKAVFEPSAMVFVSINPNHISKVDGVAAVRDALPFVICLAEKLRKQYHQFVVPFSAVSPCWSVRAASKPKNEN